MTTYAREHKLTIAVMGCRVNGPGETDDADLGLWCGPTHVNLKRGSEELGAFLRTEGVHLAELEQWRKLAEEALGAGKRLAPSKETRRLKAELARKEKALAETAALLVLKKKVAEIWGDEDDDTGETSD